MAAAPASADYSGLSLTEATKLVKSVHANLNSVKVYKQYCSELVARCQCLSDLLLDKRASREKSDDSRVLSELFCGTSFQLHQEFTTWCNLGRLKSFLQRTKIKETLDKLHHDIDCGVVGSRLEHDLGRRSLESEASEARDQDELRFVLQKIVENSNDMKSLLTLGTYPIEDIMGSLQSELSNSELDDAQHQVFQHGLWFLYQATTKLPPRQDLTGQVELQGRYPISESRRSKAYSGRWLSREPVILLRARTGVQARDSFKRWAAHLRELYHPNLTPIYGYASIDGELCLVQQRAGAPLDFAQLQPLSVIDKLRILIDAAAGLDYLHSNATVHGDLCISSVLLSPRGIALLSSFSMGSPEHVPEAPTCPVAPDMANRVPHSQSARSDVWSFGVLCLEVLTGKQQSTDSIDHTPVPSLFNDLILPDNTVSTRRIWDGLLALTRQCLHPGAESRPSMTYVKDELVKFGSLVQDGMAIPNSLSRTSAILVNGSQTSDSGQYSSMERPKSPMSAYPQPSIPGRRMSHSSLSSNFRSLNIRAPLEYSDSPSFPHASPVPSVARSPTTPLPVSPTSPLVGTPVSASSMDANLLEAITNAKSIILLDEHGLPRAATLQGLIDHLIREFDTGSDTVYREIFFTGCSDFTTSEDMFSTLYHRFQEAAKDRTYRLQCPRKSILMIIGYWLEERNYHISQELLTAMKQMGKMACSQKHCSEEQSIAQNIIRRVEDRLSRQVHISLPPMTPGRKLLRTSDITPRDLAIALTLLEGDRYKAILPADYISHLMEKPTPNNIKAAYQTNNKIVLWVKQSVLHYPSVAARAQVFKFFINVAVECQSLHNFASLTAIVNALDSAPLNRLRLTKKEISLPLRDSLHGLERLLNPEANHRAYREELKNSTTDSQRNLGIPWIAVHLRELYSTLQNNPPTIRVDGTPLINFRRYVKFTERIKQVLHYTPPDLERHRHHGHLAYVEHQLRSVYLDAQNDDDLMARSMALEAEESRDYKTRKMELKRLGFRA